MRARLVFAMIATAVVVGLAAWGFLPGAHRTTAGSTGPSPSISAAPSPSVSSTQASGPPGQAGKWNLELNAKFSGSALDTAIWDTCYPWTHDFAAGCTNSANAARGTEREWYLPSQVRVRNGSLQLTAKLAPTPGTLNGKSEEFACRSGMVTAFKGLKFKYGYVQVVAHIPGGPGLWPALWLEPSNKDWPPEIDILEHWYIPGKNPPQVTGAFDHFLQGGTPHQSTYEFRMSTLAKGWHTFSLLWTPSELSWYVDGHHLVTVTTAAEIPHQTMFFIANLADKVTDPGDCNGTMELRSVKIWQPAS